MFECFFECFLGLGFRFWKLFFDIFFVVCFLFRERLGGLRVGGWVGVSRVEVVCLIMWG